MNKDEFTNLLSEHNIALSTFREGAKTLHIVLKYRREHPSYSRIKKIMFSLKLSWFQEATRADLLAPNSPFELMLRKPSRRLEET